MAAKMSNFKPKKGIKH